jgi:hypothetical protein
VTGAVTLAKHLPEHKKAVSHPSQIISTLSPQQNLDDQPAHRVVYFEIFLWTSWVRIVTTNAGLADGAVRIDGLELGLIADLDPTGGRPFWMLLHSF